MFAQIGQLPVFRAKIVTPFADAMSLVDRDLGDVPLSRCRKKSVEHESFRRDVEQTIFATMEPAEARLGFVPNPAPN